MATVTYKQCQLKRTETPGGALTTTVSYIPSQYATRGKLVDLKEENEEGVNWETWQVTAVGTTELSEDQAKKIAKRWHQFK